MGEREGEGEFLALGALYCFGEVDEEELEEEGVSSFSDLKIPFSASNNDLDLWILFELTCKVFEDPSFEFVVWIRLFPSCIPWFVVVKALFRLTGGDGGSWVNGDTTIWGEMYKKISIIIFLCNLKPRW